MAISDMETEKIHKMHSRRPILYDISADDQYSPLSPRSALEPFPSFRIDGFSGLSAKLDDYRQFSLLRYTLR